MREREIEQDQKNKEKEEEPTSIPCASEGKKKRSLQNSNTDIIMAAVCAVL